MDEQTRASISQRLGNLRQEYAAGEQQMAALDARRAELNQTMLRITGAIQVLEETLAET